MRGILSPPPSFAPSPDWGCRYADPVPAGDGGAMHEPGGMITDVDSMVQMTKFEYSVPGSWNDAGLCVHMRDG